MVLLNTQINTYANSQTNCKVVQNKAENATETITTAKNQAACNRDYNVDKPTDFS